MDHMMPGIDGVEATRIIREEIGTEYARNIPIIALTANAIVGNEEMFLNSGFQDFISKPIDVAKLDAVLNRWVRNRTLEKDREDPAGDDASSGSETPVSAAIRAIDGVDGERALQRFSGDETLLRDVLRSYAANTPPMMKKLRESLVAGDFEEYGIVIHGLKGASNGIFAQKAGRAAEALEVAAKTGNFVGVRNGHTAFEKIMESLLAGIAGALDSLGADAGALPAAASPDPALLAELRAACGAFEMDRVDSAMDSLESFRYEQGGNLVAWLRERVDAMEFEEISSGEWPSE
jgi:CheY-like chemotaxis protein